MGRDGGLHLIDFFPKEKMSVDSWPVFRHLLVFFVYVYVLTFSKEVFQAIFFRPREQAETLATNTVESCLGFLLCLI